MRFIPLDSTGSLVGGHAIDASAEISASSFTAKRLSLLSAISVQSNGVAVGKRFDALVYSFDLIPVLLPGSGFRETDVSSGESPSKKSPISKMSSFGMRKTGADDLAVASLTLLDAGVTGTKAFD